MPLVRGLRLEGMDRNAYLVGECLSATPWFDLYAAKKLFYNFRYDEREFYEAADDEWADVRLRVCRQPKSAELNEINRRRRLLRYEMTEVLGRHAGWLAEPVDWLDNSGGEPVLVMSVAHGETLRSWRQAQTTASSQALDVAAEVLDLLNSLHQKQQIVGGFGPEDFLIDETGRLSFIPTDRILPVEQAVPLRRYFPPNRYPARFSAPEAGRASAALGRPSDLFSWAALTLFLLTGSILPSDFGWKVDRVNGESDGPEFSGEGLGEQLPTALNEIAGRDLDSLQSLLPRGKRATKGDLVAAWTDCLCRCLAFDPAARPASVDDLRQVALTKSAAASPLSRFWRSVYPTKR